MLVGYVSLQICALLAPCRRPILIATKDMLFRGQDTNYSNCHLPLNRMALRLEIYFGTKFRKFRYSDDTIPPARFCNHLILFQILKATQLARELLQREKKASQKPKPTRPMTNNAIQRRTSPTSSNPACALTGPERPNRHIALESERNYL